MGGKGIGTPEPANHRGWASIICGEGEGVLCEPIHGKSLEPGNTPPTFEF